MKGGVFAKNREKRVIIAKQTNEKETLKNYV